MLIKTQIHQTTKVIENDGLDTEDSTQSVRHGYDDESIESLQTSFRSFTFIYLQDGRIENADWPQGFRSVGASSQYQIKPFCD